jgi:hypothetical protein
VFFVERILPLFGELGEGKDLTLWATIAGSLLTPIDIVDGSGTILFRAPSPLGNTKSFVSPGHGNSLFEVMELVVLHERRLPGSGTPLLQQGMRRHLTIAPEDTANRNQWREIFKRYNKPFPYDIDSAAAEETPSAMGSAGRQALTDVDEDF